MIKIPIQCACTLFFGLFRVRRMRRLHFIYWNEIRNEMIYDCSQQAQLESFECTYPYLELFKFLFLLLETGDVVMNFLLIIPRSKRARVITRMHRMKWIH